MCEKFLNPYHFISLLKDGKDLYEEEVGQEKYTGVLSYTITTKTPLMIPGTIITYKDKIKKEHPYKRFFTYEDNVNDKSLLSTYKPAIPGSEIRGTIRSIYETLTNSCLSMTDAEKLITRRINDIFEPALIQRTETDSGVSYKLLKASRKPIDYDIIDEQGLKDGACINNMWQKTGYLLKGEKPNEDVGETPKKHYSVFFKDGEKEESLSDLSAQDIENLKNILKVYDDPRVNKQIDENRKHWYEEYRQELELFLSGERNHLFPVYYSIVQSEKKTKIYLSPACITKEIYENRAIDLIKGYEPCKKKKKVCPACRLFGMAGENNEEALAGKLRFTDLHPVPDNGSETKSYYYKGKNSDSNNMVTLKELSNPKPSTAEFYLKKPESENETVLSWNYDYYVCQDAKGNIKCMTDEDGYEAQIMGRKYYWHNLSPDYSIDRKGDIQEQKTKRNQTVQLVDQEITFEGEIYFEDISETELRRLAWICNISSFWKNHGYKIGGGKPLGLGSVEMKVSKIYKRMLFISEQDGKIKYNGKREEENELQLDKLFEKFTEDQYYSQGCQFHNDEKLRAQFELLTTFLNGEDSPADKKNILISYPFASKTENDTEDETKGYQWFANNQVEHSSGDREKFVDRKSMRFDQYLKELSDIPNAMLNSTIAENPETNPDMPHTGQPETKTTDSKKETELLNSTKMENSENEAVPEPVSTLNGEYTATIKTIKSIDKGKKKCNFEIYFTLDDGTTGKIDRKKPQIRKWEKGSKINVTYKNGKPM